MTSAAAAVTVVDDVIAGPLGEVLRAGYAPGDKHMRVSSSSSPHKLASAISHAVSENSGVTLRAIGSTAISLALEGLCLARGLTAPRGFDLACVPGFVQTQGSRGDEVMAMTLRVVQIL